MKHSHVGSAQFGAAANQSSQAQVNQQAVYSMANAKQPTVGPRQSKVIRQKPLSYGGSGPMVSATTKGMASAVQPQKHAMIFQQQDPRVLGQVKSKLVQQPGVSKSAGRSGAPAHSHRKQQSMQAAVGSFIQAPVQERRPTVNKKVVSQNQQVDQQIVQMQGHKKSQSEMTNKLVQLLLKAGPAANTTQQASERANQGLKNSQLSYDQKALLKSQGASAQSNSVVQGLVSNSQSQEGLLTSYDQLQAALNAGQMKMNKPQLNLGAETAEQELNRILAADQMQKGPQVMHQNNQLRKSYEVQNASSSFVNASHANKHQIYGNNSFNLSHNSQDNTMNIQENMIYMQQQSSKIKPGQPVHQTPGISSSFKVSGGQKLLSKSKIISSANAVKKPAGGNIPVKGGTGVHSKTKSSFIGNTRTHTGLTGGNMVKQQAHALSLPSSSNQGHARTKSDQLASGGSQNVMSAGPLSHSAVTALHIQQRGKNQLGKILKNNWLPGNSKMGIHDSHDTDISGTPGMMGALTSDGVASGAGSQIATIDSNVPQTFHAKPNKNLLLVPNSDFISGAMKAPPPTNVNITQELSVEEATNTKTKFGISARNLEHNPPLSHKKKSDQIQRNVKTTSVASSVVGFHQKLEQQQFPKSQTEHTEPDVVPTAEEYRELKRAYNELLKQVPVNGKQAKQQPAQPSLSASEGGLSTGMQTNVRINRYYNLKQQKAKLTEESCHEPGEMRMRDLQSGASFAEEVTDVSPVMNENPGGLTFDQRVLRQNYRQTKTMLTQQQQQAQPHSNLHQVHVEEGMSSAHHRPTKSMQINTSNPKNCRELKQPVHTRTVSNGNNQLSSNRGNEGPSEQLGSLSKSTEMQQRQSKMYQANLQSDQALATDLSVSKTKGPSITPDKGLKNGGGSHRRSVSDGNDSSTVLKFKSKFLHQSTTAQQIDSSYPPTQSGVSSSATGRTTSKFKDQAAYKLSGPGSSQKSLQGLHGMQPKKQDTQEDENIQDSVVQTSQRANVVQKHPVRQLQPNHNRLKSDDLQKHLSKNNSAYFQQNEAGSNRILNSEVDQPAILVGKQQVATTATPQSSIKEEQASQRLKQMGSKQKVMQSKTQKPSKQIVKTSSNQDSLHDPSGLNMVIQENSPISHFAKVTATSSIEHDNEKSRGVKTGDIRTVSSTSRDKRPGSNMPGSQQVKKSKALDLNTAACQIQSGRPSTNCKEAAKQKSNRAQPKVSPLPQAQMIGPQGSKHGLEKKRYPSTSSTRRTQAQMQAQSAGTAVKEPPCNRQVNNLFGGNVNASTKVNKGNKLELMEKQAVGGRKVSLGQSLVQQTGPLKNAKQDLCLSKNQKQLKTQSLGKQQLINSNDGQNVIQSTSSKKLGGLGLRGEHKRVKSDANDQNKVRMINGNMFVQASHQMADRSVKTLPKRIKNTSLDVSKHASKRISPQMMDEQEEGDESMDQRPKLITAQQMQNFFIEEELDRGDSNEKHVNVSIDQIEDPEIEEGSPQLSVENRHLNSMNMEPEDHADPRSINNFQEQVLSKFKFLNQIGKNVYNPKQKPVKEQVTQKQPTTPSVDLAGNHSISGGVYEQNMKRAKYKKLQQQRQKNQYSKSELPSQYQGENPIVVKDQESRPMNATKAPQPRYFQGAVDKMHVNRKSNTSVSPNSNNASAGPQQPAPHVQVLQQHTNQQQPSITFNMQISPKIIFNQQTGQAQDASLANDASHDLVNMAMNQANMMLQQPNRQKPPASNASIAQKTDMVRSSQLKKQQRLEKKNIQDKQKGAHLQVPSRESQPHTSNQNHHPQYLINLQENPSIHTSENGTSNGENPGAAMYAPMNSMNIPSARSPANMVVEGHHHASDSSRKHRLLTNERIETQDSIQKDPTLSPRTKAIRKLVKHIGTTISAKNTVPQTTVDFYRVDRVLGKGAFGKVNLALHILTQSMCAIKSISKTHIAEDSQIRKVKQEVMILKRTAHPNIVQLYEYFETQKHILFVIELAAGGDLLNYVRKRRQLKEDVAKSVFKQIIDALAYCHSKQILHRDIKLDNILLDINGEVKICDFGVSKIVRQGETMTEQCGTPAYIAPEILKDEGYEGFAVDIWSAGVVLYAMLYGAVPFKANDLAELQRHIIASEYTLQDCISQPARDLLAKILDNNPRTRITIANIRKHPWMKDAKDRVELFTEAEKNYMRKEIVNTDNLNDGYERKDTDPFNQMLETMNGHNSSVKNAETKSVILAPFNSTKSNLGQQNDEEWSLPSSIAEFMQSRSVIKFHGKVREINFQYEVNNNQELDNGVYHDYWQKEGEKEDKDSLKGSFDRDNTIEGEKDKKGSELARLENEINKQQDIDQPYGGIESKQKPSEAEEAGLGKVLSCPSESVQIDQSIVDSLTGFGFGHELVRTYLNNKDLNCATTSYYLLKSQKAKQEDELSK